MRQWWVRMRAWTERALEKVADEFGDRITVRVITGASHALFPEQPDAVARAIDAWARVLPP